MAHKNGKAMSCNIIKTDDNKRQKNRVCKEVERGLASAGILKQSISSRNRVGIGLSYRPARLLRLAELITWNQFLASKVGLWPS
jgi:hypothetical protein